MNINERIRHLRKNVLNVTQAEFAKDINISRSNLGNIEVGNVAVTERVEQDICKSYNINREWLRTGNGTMYAQPEANKDEVKEFADKMNLSEIERKILSIYLKLSDTDRKKLEDFAYSFAQKMAEEDKKTAPDKKSEADELKVAESAAQYKGISEPDKEAFDKQLEYEQATKGKSSVSPTDDGENVV